MKRLLFEQKNDIITCNKEDVKFIFLKLITVVVLLISSFTNTEAYDKTYLESTWSNKDYWQNGRADDLVLDNIYGKLTDNEIAGMKKFVLSFPLPTHNYDNYYFKARAVSYMLEWVYEKDGDKALLNRAIEIARRAIMYRNDNIDMVNDKYPVVYADFTRSDDRGAVWPNYKNKGSETINGKTYIACGAGVFGGFPAVTVPIKMIADNPSIWNENYEGISYRDIADELIDAALETIDYTYDNLVGDDNLIRYTANNTGGDWDGHVFIYNRVFPLISGSIPLVEALEIFNSKPNRVARIDEVNSAMITFFMEDFTWYKKNGYDVCYYPYSDASQDGNPTQAEDFAHGSFDGRDLQYIYKSGRYGYTKKFVEGVANTLSEVVYLRDGVFAGRLNGNGGEKDGLSPINYDGYIWYAAYNSDLKARFIDYAAANIAPRGSGYDANILFELLKLKENKYKPFNFTKDTTEIVESVSFDSLQTLLAPTKEITQKIAYSVSENREVALVLKAPNGTWLGSNKIEVSKGSGVVTLIITVADELIPAQNYKISCDIRPIGAAKSDAIMVNDAFIDVTIATSLLVLPKNEDKLQVYPNPINDNFNITLKTNDKKLLKEKILLVNQSGAVISTLQHGENQSLNIKKGIYYIVVIGNNKVKIIKSVYFQ